MSHDQAPLSDVETALLVWLRARPELDGFQFGTRRPALLAGRLPYARLARTGGTVSLPTWRHGPVLGRAGVAVQVWAGPDPADSRHACAAVLAALYAMRSVVSAGLTIVRVGSLSGLAPVPDPGAPNDIHQTAAAVLVTNR